MKCKWEILSLSIFFLCNLFLGLKRTKFSNIRMNHSKSFTNSSLINHNNLTKSDYILTNDSYLNSNNKEISDEEKLAVEKRKYLSKLFHFNITNKDLKLLEKEFEASYKALKLFRDKFEAMNNKQIMNVTTSNSSNSSSSNDKKQFFDKDKNKNSIFNRSPQIKVNSINSISQKNSGNTYNNSSLNRTDSFNVNKSNSINLNDSLSDFLSEDVTRSQINQYKEKDNGFKLDITNLNNSVDNSNTTLVNSPKKEKYNKRERTKVMPKINLTSSLVNISLSLLLIGLLMGVMLGLILVMYVKSKDITEL